MEIFERLTGLKELIFSFGKNHQLLKQFSEQINALSMHNPGFGLNISNSLSPENQLRGVFFKVIERNGYFAFNINRVNLIRAREGFTNFTDAEDNGMITEWELWLIISNEDYLSRTIFHNQVVEISNINNGIQFLWQ